MQTQDRRDARQRISPPLIIGLVFGFGFGALLTAFIAEGFEGPSKKEGKNTSLNEPNGYGKQKENSSKSFVPEVIKTAAVISMAKRSRNENEAVGRETQRSDRANEESENEWMLLRKSLPDNTLIPGERAEDELRQQLEKIEEQQFLKDLIGGNKAAPKDLNRYYELQAKRFQDEISLVDFCEKDVSDSQTQGKSPMIFCSEVVAHGAERRGSAEASLRSLQQDFSNGFHEATTNHGPGRTR